jgi:hypothetical protein
MTIWHDKLEDELSVKEFADVCDDWDERPIYYVYAYRDITQIDKPFVYIGIGHDTRRAKIHWNSTHNEALSDYVTYWKNCSISNVSEVMSYVAKNLTQRQAAAVECKLIREHENDVVNIIDYWTPSNNAGASERQQKHYSNSRKGQIRTEFHNQASAEALSNNLVVELFKHDQSIKLFKRKSGPMIVAWIKKYLEVEIGSSTLWATLRGGYHPKGFYLKVLEGELRKVSVKEKIRKRIAALPVLAKGSDGEYRLFISAASAADALGSTSPKISQALTTERNSTGGYSFRTLEDYEIKDNIHLWPIYYRVNVDQTSKLVLNLNAATKEFNVKRSAFSNFIRDKKIYPSRQFTVSYGKKISCEMFEMHESEEIFDFEIKDNLSTPTPFKGYSYEKGNYKIRLTIGDMGYQTSIGRTKSEDTAQKTVSFATDLSNDSSNIDTDSSKINMIKKYLHDLKLETGEAIHKKNNHWNYDTIYSEILKIKPKNLADWENQSGGSYGAALKLGKQRELYEKYCQMIGKNPHFNKKARTVEDVVKILLIHRPKTISFWRQQSESSYQWALRENKVDTVFNQYLNIVNSTNNAG